MGIKIGTLATLIEIAAKLDKRLGDAPTAAEFARRLNEIHVDAAKREELRTLLGALSSVAREIGAAEIEGTVRYVGGGKS